MDLQEITLNAMSHVNMQCEYVYEKNPEIEQSLTKPLLEPEITLSTMTLDGYISNVKFDKEKAIDYLDLTDRIVEIGCNYGHKISENYKLMPCYKDRITKKKSKGEGKKRRSQGLGTHFNSQITFTIITDKDPLHSYQVKLFTNGRVQIPGIGKLSKNNEELLEDILTVVVSYISSVPDTLLYNPNNAVNVLYLSPILQNFKSLTLLTKDCMRDTRIMQDGDKRYMLVPFINLREFELALIRSLPTMRPPFPIDTFSFNPERYSGMTIKFSTPKVITGNTKIDKFMELAKLYYHKKVKRTKIHKPDFNETDDKITRTVKMMQLKWHENCKGSKKNRKKLTTVKLFRSGKINIDHVNNNEQAILIRKYVVDIIMYHWYSIIYYEE